MSLQWSVQDSILYANSIGMGQSTEPDGGPERSYLYRDPEAGADGGVDTAFPTLPLGLMFKAKPVGSGSSGKRYVPWENPLLKRLVSFDPRKLLHGEQAMEWNPAVPSVNFPAKADTTIATRLIALQAKKKAVVAFIESTITTSQGQELCRMLSSMFLRDATVKPSIDSKDKATLEYLLNSAEAQQRLKEWRTVLPPKVDPTTGKIPHYRKAGEMVFHLAPNQASIYRMNGDTNPIHIDTGIAQRVGLDRPIVHGLCTYGYAARGLQLIANRMTVEGSATGHYTYALTKMRGRFMNPVFDGDKLLIISKGVEGGHGVVEYTVQATTEGDAEPRVVMSGIATYDAVPKVPGHPPAPASKL